MPTNAAHHLGATAKPAPMVTIDPERLVLDEDNVALAGDSGLNGSFLADLLSDMLVHARCGFHLYRSLAGRSNNVVLARRYEQHGADAEEQITAFETLITDLGGDPGYTSPIARVTEKYDVGALEGSFMLAGSVDLMDQEMAMLNAVITSETVANANGETLAALTDSLDDGPVRIAFGTAVEAVLPPASDHLAWALDTRQRMVVLQARNQAMQTVGLGATALMDRLHGLFDDAPVPT